MTHHHQICTLTKNETVVVDNCSYPSWSINSDRHTDKEFVYKMGKASVAFSQSGKLWRRHSKQNAFLQQEFTVHLLVQLSNLADEH